MTCELALAFVSAEGAIRIAIRSTALGIGLAYLLLLPERKASPLRPWYLAVFVTMFVGALHPDSATALARLAHCMLYLAILSPLLWMPALTPNVNVLKQVLGVVWAFHTVSAFVGVLQVYFPGQFDTALSSALTNQGDEYVRSLMITLDSGEQIFRPMGLTDIPGGASYSGLYATVLGTGFLLFSRKWSARVLFAGSIGIGIASIALSQVRAAAVDAGICIIALAIVLAIRAQFAKAMLVAGVVGGAGLGGSMLALSQASEQVVSRYTSLVAESPDEVYRLNRGQFLARTLEEDIVAYPLGAGSARWGMMPMYFGDSEASLPPLHAEIQLTGWVYDGGIPLVLAYVGLLVATLSRVFKLARSSEEPRMRDWATLVLAYDIGAVALTFSYPLFVSEAGMEFWLFNAIAIGAGSAGWSSQTHKARVPAVMKAVEASS